MRNAVLVCLIGSGLLFAAGVLGARAEIRNVVVGAEHFRDFGEISPANVEIVDNDDAWHGLAVDVTGGVVGAGKLPPQAKPDAWARIEIVADAGEYYLWIRGKSINPDSDSVWIQFDDEIGTDDHQAPDIGFANWWDTQGDKFAWCSDQTTGTTVTFDKVGKHEMLMQPRQAPYIFDQIWLSMDQKAHPDDDPVELEDLDAIGGFAVDPEGKLTTTWARMKALL